MLDVGKGMCSSRNIEPDFEYQGGRDNGARGQGGDAELGGAGGKRWEADTKKGDGERQWICLRDGQGTARGDVGCGRVLFLIPGQLKTGLQTLFVNQPVYKHVYKHGVQYGLKIKFLDLSSEFHHRRESLYENTDPIEVWEALVDSAHLAELARFAIIILNIVANQAGCERTFLRTKVEQADHRNRLGLEKTDKRTKVRAEIRSEHEKQNLLKPRHARKNHKSTATLLSVPRYYDLLEDQEDVAMRSPDGSRKGRYSTRWKAKSPVTLVQIRKADPSEPNTTKPHFNRGRGSDAAGWRTEMGKWIGDARAAEREEREEAVDGGDESDNDLTSCLPNRLPVWKQMTLAVLFRGAEKPRARKPAAQAMEQEELLMQALAEAEEDGVPDDGAIEIDSDDEFRP
ncbi:hypothetical protein B0H10DRAFT_1963533 [Mycena sp. CBHHK59/15]|nr:hypothetical protein B0H10DRAFT_1963533 [Mycena sp. CBHHK59/15]